MTQPVCAIVPDVRVLLNLEPPEVAAVLLQFLNSRPPHENLGNVNLGTCITGDNLEGYPPAAREDAARACAEGWMWLLREGLVAQKPNDNFGWHFITRKGRRLRTAVDVEVYRRASAFPRQMLHPAVAAKAEPPFMRGEYDSAVFQAFKEVEVAVRAKGKFREKNYGVDLMRDAFNAEHGPLTDLRSPAAERESLAALFWGAIGSYKNPHSHRNVKIEPKEATEMIVLASHLLSIVESRHANTRRRRTNKKNA